MDNGTFPIPKRIIQTGPNPVLPLKERAMICNLRLLNPDFEYLYFDDRAVEDFIDTQFPQYRPLFDAFPFRIQRYDFFRYLVVFHHGGFYFDLDVLLASNLAELLRHGCVFAFEGLTFSRHLRDQHGMDWQVGNYAFGSAAGHPFLRAVIENCVRAQNEPSWIQPMMRGTPPLSRKEFLVLNSTGPGLVSRTLAENPSLRQDVTVLFPADPCDLTTWNRFGDLGIHLMSGSWRPQGSFLRRRLAMYWEAWTMNRLLVESRGFASGRPTSARQPLITAARPLHPSS